MELTAGFEEKSLEITVHCGAYSSVGRATDF